MLGKTVNPTLPLSPSPNPTESFCLLHTPEKQVSGDIRNLDEYPVDPILLAASILTGPKPGLFLILHLGSTFADLAPDNPSDTKEKYRPREIIFHFNKD